MVTFELLGFNALRTFQEKRKKYDRKSLSEKLQTKIMKIIPINEEKNSHTFFLVVDYLRENSIK